MAIKDSGTMCVYRSYYWSQPPWPNPPRPLAGDPRLISFEVISMMDYDSQFRQL